MTSRVLVTAASRYGATKEMARTIGSVIAARNLDVEVHGLEDLEDVCDFDAVIIGSSVYSGHWMTIAREFLTTHSAKLLERPVWLFSSVPLAEQEEETQKDVAELCELVAAREHKLFHGSISRRNLSVTERLLIMNLGVNDGDYRDWAEVRAWADAIARDLTNRPAHI